MNSFERIIAGGLRSISTMAGIQVRYGRGGSWVSLTATPGRSDFTVSDQYGAVTEVRTRDYIIQASCLRLDGQPVKPQRGDIITEESGNVYEVSRPDGNEQPWSYADAGSTHVRVHTRLKGTA